MPVRSSRKSDPELGAREAEEIARTIGLGAVKYAELSQHRMTDYVFSWSKMLSFQGNTAPYLQNAYVRIRSIFRKLEGEFAVPEELMLAAPEERALAQSSSFSLARWSHSFSRIFAQTFSPITSTIWPSFFTRSTKRVRY